MLRWFGFCWVVVSFVCFCVVLKTPSFLLSPILQHEGIDNQKQNVLMTVRASSAHGMSSKKNRGEDSLSLGAHDAQTSYPLPTLAQDGILLKVGKGCFIGLFGAHSLIPLTTCPGGNYTCLHWRQSRTLGSLTLVSVTTKHISLQWACNRHLSMVETTECYRTDWENRTW